MNWQRERREGERGEERQKRCRDERQERYPSTFIDIFRILLRVAEGIRTNNAEKEKKKTRARTKEREARKKKGPLEVTMKNSSHDHRDHATQKQHNHDGIDDGKPMHLLIRLLKVVFYSDENHSSRKGDRRTYANGPATRFC